MARLRVRFAKLGKIRWTSHRDVARMWERAFRRVELPLTYTSGFSPRPKVSFGLALPTGHESVAEYLDLETPAEDLDVQAIPARLSAVLPAGLDATAAAWVDARALSLQEDVACCTWRWAVVPAEGAAAVGSTELEARVAELLAAPTAVVTRSRKGQPVRDDVRPGIFAVHVPGPPGPALPAGVWLEADLTAKPRTLRPFDVVAALDRARPDALTELGAGAELEERDVRRTHQWIWRDGAREEPLVADGSPGATEAQ